MWDPELVLLPVFSAVAAITKVLVSRLVENPVRTLVQISPLVGHEQYRIREMTAESCLGYIMRKTRQPDALEGLVKAVLDCAEGITVPQGKGIEQSPIVHGAGAAIFEAMRSPSGGLHARAMQVLTTALQHSGKSTHAEKAVETVALRRSNRKHSVSDPVKPEKSSPLHSEESSTTPRFRFAILVHAVARVCSHIKQKPESASEIVAEIVRHGDEGVQRKNAEVVADAVFLLRHCLNATVAYGRTVLPDAYVQRIANLSVQGIRIFPKDRRTCHEAFLCFIAILERAPAQCSHRATVSMKKLLVSMVREISRESAVAMLKALCALLDKTGKSFDTDQLIPVVSVLSNSLADGSGAMTKILREEMAENSGPQSASGSCPHFVALLSGIKFLESAQDKTMHFNAPDLDKEVVLGLSAVVSMAEEQKVSLFSTEAKGSFPALMQVLLRYTSLVEVSAAAPYLARLAAIPMRPELLAIVASSVLRYESSCFDLRSEEMEEKLHKIVRSLLQNAEGGLVCGDVISAINVYIRKHDSSSLVKGLPKADVDRILQALSFNLSSTTAAVRMESAVLLRQMSLSMAVVDHELKKMRGPSILDVADAAAIRSRLAEPRDAVCLMN